jgi:threonine/homoserine/homoserine lactone efflux protein
MSGLLAFVAVAIVVIVTPGQDTALTVRNTLTGGRRAGVRTAAGVVCGQAVWALAASAGLAALLAALRRRGDSGRATGAPARGRPWRQGLLSNLANPKMAVFFTSLLPQFGDSFASLLGLGLLFCALTMLWLTAYAVAVARAGDVLRRAPVRRAIDAGTGVALVAFGVRLATGQNSA